MRTVEKFIAVLPHARALGIELDSFDAQGRCVLRLPWREDLIADPQSGVVHGGVITALLDTLGAACVIARGIHLQATLDLRIDYLRSAQPRVALIGDASCYRVTRQIAFVRGVCHQGDPEHAVANVTATFIRAEEKP
jgi:uncharacterized protein (TIGR00369 family)